MVKCNRDGIGKGEKKEREDSIRKTDTDLYNKTNLQKLQYSMCCSINCSTTEREEEILYSLRKDYSKWKTRVKEDTRNPAAKSYILMSTQSFQRKSQNAFTDVYIMELLQHFKAKWMNRRDTECPGISSQRAAEKAHYVLENWRRKTEDLRKKPGGTEEGRDTNKWSCGWGLVSYCCFCCAAQRWKACCERARLVAPYFQLQSLLESMLDNDLYTLLKIYNWKYMRPNIFKSVRFRQSALCLVPLLNMGNFILGYTLTSHFNRYTCSTANANI